MKTKRGLTRKKSVLYHILQQLGMWLAAMSAACLVLYSFISVKVENENIVSRRLTYDWNLFSESRHFDETESFDSILWDSLHDIIRYNVAKSQLERDGVFDGSKVIDIQSFVNRRENGTELSGKEDDEYLVPVEYYLKDLIKWQKYGINYISTVLSEEQFVFYFGNKYYVNADRYLTGEEVDALGAYLEDVYLAQLFSEYYGYISGDVYEKYAESMEEYEEYMVGPAEEPAAEAEGVSKGQSGSGASASVGITVTKITEITQLHEAMADILLDGGDSCVEDIYVDSTGEVWVVVRMLEERYQPIDTRNNTIDTIADCANGWDRYNLICGWLEQAVADISYNYGEYLGFQERYSAENSNIDYHCEMSMMGESVRVSNSSLDSWTGLDEYYRENYGRYLIYRPEDMIFETNMGTEWFNEESLFEAFSKYEYAYPETAHIWLGIDTSYPAVDIISRANDAYAAIHPVVYLIAATGVAGLLLWFGLFLYLSVKTGWRREEDGEEGAVLTLGWFDDIPTELTAGIGAGAACLLVIAGKMLLEYFHSFLETVCVHRFQNALLLSGYAVLCSLLFCLFWYSLLRRIKAHTLWKNSLLCMLWQKGIKRPLCALGRMLLKFYDNSGVFFRSLFILGGIMGLNLFFGFYCATAVMYHNRLFLLLFIPMIVFTDAAVLSFWIYHHLKRKRIIEAIKRIREGELDCQIGLEKMHGENRQLAEAVNSIGAGIKTAVETSMKDERLKADLITNVSHDIKTPLTSIINYVDLLKRERIEQEPAKTYIGVLENKSWRLKQLTDDLLEASKISSGNITLHPENIDLTELLKQALGEFSEKFEEKNLTVIESCPQKEVCIEADSRRIWRVMENLFNNICKYALSGTRVYLDMQTNGEEVTLSMKNISAQSLNIPAEELTERFIRGDVSRNTEGSGLGLSIAKSLVEMQKGRFEIYLDGDLFKVTLVFPLLDKKEESQP